MRNRYDVSYRSMALKAARELNYGKEVILKIRAAKTDAEICRIMATAREEKEEC